MQSISNFLELFSQDAGAGQAAHKLGVKLPLKARFSGDRDATGFADIMGGLMRLPAGQVPAAIGHLDLAAMQQAGADLEQMPLSDASQSGSRQGDRILNGLLRAGGEGPGDDIHAPAAGLGDTIPPLDGLPLHQPEPELDAPQAGDAGVAELNALNAPVPPGSGEAVEGAAETPDDPRTVSALRGDASGSNGGAPPKPVQAIWTAAGGERTPVEQTAFPSEKSVSATGSVHGESARPDFAKADKVPTPVAPPEQAQAHSAAEQAPVQERKLSTPGIVKMGPANPSGSASGSDSDPLAGNNARFSGDMSDEGRSDEGRSHSQSRHGADGRSAGKLEQSTAFVPPTAAGAAPVATASSETAPPLDVRGFGGQTGQTQKSDSAAADPAPVSKDVQTDVMRQIVQRMSMRTDGRQSQMQIQLKPEFLGNLRMQVITENQQVTIRMVAANSAVKQIIEQNSHVLRAELQQHGLQIQKLEVTVAPDSEPWHNGQSPNTFGQSRQRGGNEGRRRDNAAPAAVEADVARTSGAARTGHGASGEVDFFA